MLGRTHTLSVAKKLFMHLPHMMVVAFGSAMRLYTKGISTARDNICICGRHLTTCSLATISVILVWLSKLSRLYIESLLWKYIVDYFNRPHSLTKDYDTHLMRCASKAVFNLLTQSWKSGGDNHWMVLWLVMYIYSITAYALSLYFSISCLKIAPKNPIVMYCNDLLSN